MPLFDTSLGNRVPEPFPIDKDSLMLICDASAFSMSWAQTKSDKLAKKMKKNILKCNSYKKKKLGESSRKGPSGPVAMGTLHRVAAGTWSCEQKNFCGNSSLKA